MATVEDLKISVAKAEEKVVKCKATIVRHGVQLEKKQLDVRRLIGVTPTPEIIEQLISDRAGKNDPHFWSICEVRNKMSDIKGAETKLREAEAILDGWQKKLDLAEEKERFIAGEVPQTIKDFMEQWKEQATKWHVKRLEGYRKLCKKLEAEELAAHIAFAEMPGNAHVMYLTVKGKIKPEYRNTSNIVNYVVNSRKQLREHLQKMGLDWKSIQVKGNEYAGNTVLKMSTFREEAAMMKWLDRQLEAEKKSKMMDLVQRVNAVVGKITDASGLYVGNKGNLNGFVIGTKDKAEVETIGAGGYNIQCFHFRVLVHPVDKVERKKKAARKAVQNG